MTISDVVAGNLTMLYLVAIAGTKAYGLISGQGFKRHLRASCVYYYGWSSIDLEFDLGRVSQSHRSTRSSSSPD
ncbi:hypothetical protein ACSBR2_019312 [Camellia fascicularis]